MKNILEERTLVVVGSWNLAILNPEWLARNIFEAEGLEMQIVIPSGQPLIRYKHESVLMTPQEEKVIFSCLDSSDDCSARVEALVNRLLEKLPVTPVSAIGINFGYMQQDIPENIAKIFNAPDVPLFAQHNMTMHEMFLVRHLLFEDRELRFRMNITPEDTVKVHFNFHKPVSSADEARAAIREKTAAYRQASIGLLRDIYQLVVENDE